MYSSEMATCEHDELQLSSATPSSHALSPTVVVTDRVFNQRASHFRPLFNRVLVQRLAAETKTKAGIMLPEKSLGKVLQGTVVAVGPGNRLENGTVVAPAVSVGEKVLLPEYGGTKVTLEDEEYTLVRDDDILGVFNK